MSDEPPDIAAVPARRPYRQGQRAERREETRRRIVDAVVALHREVGPARTTISGIAARAGVERLTVYRHFGSERELFLACSAQWSREVPAPDPAAWMELEPGPPRLRAALGALYDFYRCGADMLAHVTRDAEQLPVVEEILGPWRDEILAWRHPLSEGWDAKPAARPRLLAALGHALRFETWRSLATMEGLEDEQAVELMIGLVTAAAGPAAPAVGRCS